MWHRSILISIALTAAASSAAPFTQDEARAIVGNVERVVTTNGIDEAIAVPINGTQQWITIKGRDRDNPILLFIHGGPAAPEMPTSWTFQNPWEDYFTVVQWDQRGAGKTYNANDPAKIAPTLTLPQMISDTEAMVTYLRTTFHKDKIFVIGHSWGTVLGLNLAARHPEWLYAYIGMGQIIDSKRAEKVGYDATLAEAERTHNEAAIKALKGIAPYPEADGSVPLDKLNIERQWSVALGGLTYNRTGYGYYFQAGKLSPDYTNADFEAIDKGSELTMAHLREAFATADYTKMTDFRCPIVMFEGRHDTTTPSGIVADWFEHVHAPVKKFVWFENSAHMMQIEEPGRVLVHLVEDVRPLAK